MRTAAAANAAVLIAKHKTTAISPLVEKVASGATSFVPIVLVNNLAAALAKLKKAGYWLAVSQLAGAESIYETNLVGNIALVIGHEHKGVRHLTAQAADFTVCVPMSASINSLNVAVATGVMLFEIARQK